jgi:hypothetical protein
MELDITPSVKNVLALNDLLFGDTLLLQCFYYGSNVINERKAGFNCVSAQCFKDKAIVGSQPFHRGHIGQNVGWRLSQQRSDVRIKDAPNNPLKRRSVGLV